MFKKFAFIFLFILSVFIFWCSSNSEKKEKIINFWNYTLSIDDNFLYYPISWDNLKDMDVLYSFRKKENSSFTDSLVILEYKKDFPNSPKEFFSIVKEKLLKSLIWSKILEEDDKDIKWAKMYYFLYEVSDDLFGQNKNDKKYYWLQAYIFTNTHKIYIISYLSIDLDEVKNILDKVKDLKFNEK